MIKSKIIIENINHNGKNLECYIPQINIGNGFKSILGNNSYILKEGYNPILNCSNCSGQGCKSCNGKGTIKGISKDHLEIVTSMLDDELKKVNEAIKLLNKYQ